MHFTTWVLDRLPFIYGPVMKLLLRRVPSLRRRVVEFASLRKGEKVLEVGCGKGDLSILMATQGVNVTGIDLSQNLLKNASKRARKLGLDINFKQADITDLPFEDSCFDVVISTLTFHYLSEEEKELALKEIFRVLKPGGRFVAAEFGGKLDWLQKSLSQFGGLKDEFLKKNGFRIEEEKKLPSAGIVLRRMRPLKGKLED